MYWIIILSILILIAFTVWLKDKKRAENAQITHTLGFNSKSFKAHELLDGTMGEDLIRVGEFAELSRIVYREVKEDEGVNNSGSWRKLDIDKLSAPHDDSNKHYLDGLHYEIWVSENQPDHIAVAIVFRGSRPDKNDWNANGRWFRRIFIDRVFDHYDQLKVISTDIIVGVKKYYKESDRPLKFIATGHSLGGGLAQFMAYATPEVKLVYGFNPSPVTGYYDIKPAAVRNANKQGVKIYRIFESGEALSFIRFIMMILYPVPLLVTKNPEIVRVRFSFIHGDDPVDQHKVELMIENIKNIVRKKEKEE